jgi:alkylation response protein AidB-like acyl-CoA dehydrogenase
VGALTFRDHRAPAEAVIGEPGRGLRVLDFAFVVERILTGIGIAACLEPLLEASLSRAEERKAFGRPIGDYQYVQEHIVNIHAGIELVRSAAWRAVDSLMRGEDCSALASVVKMTAARVFHESAIGALRVQGNHGYHRGHTIERFVRDAAGVFFAGGTEEIHKNIIWRKLQQQRAKGKSRAADPGGG